MPSDLIVLTASNGENLKLAERFVQAAAGQNASAQLIDLTQLDLPLFTPRVQAAGRGLTWRPCTTSCSKHRAG